MTRPMLSIDPELGPMRYCRRCDEWWPDDAEFWVTWRSTDGYIHHACRCCWRERNRAYSQRRSATAG